MTEFRRHFRAVLDWVIASRERVLITLRGKPACVMVPVEDYELRALSRNKLTSVVQGLAESSGGRTAYRGSFAKYIGKFETTHQLAKRSQQSLAARSSVHWAASGLFRLNTEP